MKQVVALMVVVAALAGCSGSELLAEVTAKQAADASVDAVTDEYDYLLFLGITGTEGPLNWTLYEEALRGASDPGATIADEFDQDRAYGVNGDGRLGSWLTTHFVFDEDRQLLGGLYTQYSEDGVRSVYAPFRGPYAGTPGLPGLQQHALMSFMAGQSADEQGGATLCGLVSSRDQWTIDSAAAVELAKSRPLMAQHIQEFPEGEFTYYYFPKLDVEAGCPASLDTESNFWMITHVDMDEYLAGGLPAMAEVRIDAATGEILAEAVRPLFARSATVTELEITDTDPIVLSTAPTTRSVAFIVEPLVQTLDITIQREQRPDLERSARTQLIDPSGRPWDSHQFDGPSHGYRVTAPAPGQWTLEYVTQPIQPGGAHHVGAEVVAHYT